MNTPYNKYVLHMLGEILTNLDRDPDSPTYGSFDRNFWHYKIRDFSSAILQQSVLSLALAYSVDFKGNCYYKKDIIKQYAIAGIRYWAKIQKRGGYFQEYWACERSIPATAFSLYAVCEACDVLKIDVKFLTGSIKKAVNFLLTNVEAEALNQEIASAAAVMYSGRILNDGNMKNTARCKMDDVLKKQSPDGFFGEYGGADVGYLTVSLDFLARYYECCKDEKILSVIDKVINFIKYFVHPDGSFGGEYCTRNTEYFLPYGFEYAKKVNDSAPAIIERLMRYVNEKDFLNASIDERYVLHYTASSFLKAIKIYDSKANCAKLPCDTRFDKYFNDSMLYVKSTDNFYFLCSFMKAGVFKVMNKNNFRMYTDTGYRLYKKNRIYTAEWPHNNIFTIEGDEVTVNAFYCLRKFITQTPLKQTLLKVLSFIFGRAVIHIAKKMLIYGNKKNRIDATLMRQIRFTDANIFVKDIINVGHSGLFAGLTNGLSMRHTASSKFFQINSLENYLPDDKYKIDRHFEKERTLSF
ncbi:MAG: hypothetical protein PHP69_04090 [Candidatus Omnitrophica bacterium]|nr:hypothetical protein [Candidatus Omnitrophota bacterium]